MMLDANIVQFAFNVLLQSTLLIAVGFVAIRFCRKQPTMQSAILRATLVAVLVCPVASAAFGRLGIPGLAILPAVTSADESHALANDREEQSAAEGDPIANTSASSHVDVTVASMPTGEFSQPVTETLPAATPVEAAIETAAPIAAEPVTLNATPSPRSSADVAVQTTPKASQPASTAGVVVTLLWVVGAAVLLARLCLANWFISRLRRTSESADEHTTELCRETSATLGLTAPDLKLSSRIHSPCLIGIVRPAILLPQGDPVSRPVLRDVFLHELAHLARRDCLFHLLARVATAILFFQPLMWLLSRRLEQLADDVCDDYVVQYGTSRKTYAHTLVDFAEQLPAQWATANAGLGMVSLRSSLSRRVLRIMDSSRSIALRLSPMWLLAIAVLGISATVSAALIVNAPNGAEPAKEKSQADAAVETDKANIAKPAAETPVKDEAADNGDKKATKPHTYKFRGTVIDPAGKPVRGAKIHFYSWQVETPGVLAITDAKGEFAHEISPADPLYARVTEDGGSFVATADGFGLAVKSAHECETSGELMRAFQRRIANAPIQPNLAQELKKLLSGPPTFKLVKDDTPLTGVVVDADGQPVAGAKLYVAKISEPRGDGVAKWEEDVRKPDMDSYQLRRNIRMSFGNDVGERVLSMIPPAVTDQAGKFTFKGLGQGRILRLVISGPGIATSRVHARTWDGEDVEVKREPRAPNRKILFHPANFTHVAGPSQAVEGVVVDSKTKQPIPGVRLQSYHLAGQFLSGWTEGIVNTVTDKNGRFRLEGLPIGRNEVLNLASLDEPYITSKFRAETTVGAKPLQKRIELTRGIWIEGKAYDKSTNEPIRSGRVEYFAFLSNPNVKGVQGLNGAHISNRYRLKSDGTYRLPGLPGRGIVGVMADRDHEKYQRGAGADDIKGKDAGMNGFRTYPYYMSAFNFHVLREVNPKEDDAVVKLDIEFDSGKALSVKVVDPDGKPVSGAEYTGLLDYSSWRSYQGSELRINGYQPSKPRRVQVYHQERKLAGMMVIDDKNPSDLTLTLQPTAEVTGRLLDAAGLPIADARLSNDFSAVQSDPAFAVLPPSPKRFVGQRDFKTDKDGRFNIVGLVANRKHTLSATEIRKNGLFYGLGNIDVDLTLKPGETRDLGDVSVKARR